MVREEDLPIDIYYNKLLGKYHSIYIKYFKVEFTIPRGVARVS